MSAYSFRALTNEDADKLRELRRAVVAVSPIGMGTTLDEELQRPEAFFRSQLSFEAPSRVFGAFSGSKLVATAGIRWPTKHPSGKHKTILYGVQTAPEFRRHGLGRRLVQQAIDHAFSSGCLRIYLYVYVPNAEAVFLYEALGFVASGAEPEELNIEDHYYDLQYMSLRNASIPAGGRDTKGLGRAA
jgi:ribosomal protein S18 acetylase RimI-like enzyme